MALKRVKHAPASLAVAPSRKAPTAVARLEHLRALESKILWLAVWMIHHANQVRPRKDGLKVGGHQASSASCASIMTALFLDVLTPRDRVAVKPHASPIFHAIQYLFGRQTVEKMQDFRALGGVQSYPSRTKDIDDVDFSTGSVGLGVAMTSFASLVQDYVQMKSMLPADRCGRMVAIVGDAELDEGNVFEALLEGWKHDIRNVWWVIDYNRQSLDAVVSDRLFMRLDSIFKDMGWRVVTLKYGRRMSETFRKPGGDAVKAWIDESSNTVYSALSFQGGHAWRTQLREDIGDQPGVDALLASLDDAALHAVMTDLGGHDLETLTQAFHSVKDDTPTCFIAYTIKGMGLPFAGHKDNHAGQMTGEQVAAFKARLGIEDGDEWERFSGLEDRAEALDAFLRSVPFAQQAVRRFDAPKVAVPATLEVPGGERVSTQEAFGRVVASLARQHPALADHIVTTAPDVTTSTNLGPWVNRRGIFSRHEEQARPIVSQVASPQQWTLSPQGQHIELGIAENNLFIMLAALGLSHSLFGVRLLPIGTVYDPFVSRGLDALNYACYQDARFILAGTPSGITLAPEGGAHQSIYTTLIGMGQPNLVCYEPAFADDLTEIVRWSLEHIQQDDGSAVYLRLSTRPIPQPAREYTEGLRRQVIDGGYWLHPPQRGAELAVVACGAVLPEAMEAHRQLVDEIPGAGLLVVTSPGRLERGWAQRQRSGPIDGDGSHVETLLRPLSASAGLVTVLDGYPSTLGWLGSVHGHRVVSLGVDRFGQSGDIPDLYRLHGIDADAIVDAAARLCVMARVAPRSRHVD